jgi:hypothetical protein
VIVTVLVAAFVINFFILPVVGVKRQFQH